MWKKILGLQLFCRALVQSRALGHFAQSADLTSIRISAVDVLTIRRVNVCVIALYVSALRSDSVCVSAVDSDEKNDSITDASYCVCFNPTRWQYVSQCDGCSVQ